jgi:hypothetical protein
MLRFEVLHDVERSFVARKRLGEIPLRPKYVCYPFIGHTEIVLPFNITGILLGQLLPDAPARPIRVHTHVHPR